MVACFLRMVTHDGYQITPHPALLGALFCDAQHGFDAFRNLFCSMSALSSHVLLRGDGLLGCIRQPCEILPLSPQRFATPHDLRAESTHRFLSCLDSHSYLINDECPSVHTGLRAVVALLLVGDRALALPLVLFSFRDSSCIVYVWHSSMPFLLEAEALVVEPGVLAIEMRWQQVAALGPEHTRPARPF